MDSDDWTLDRHNIIVKGVPAWIDIILLWKVSLGYTVVPVAVSYMSYIVVPVAVSYMAAL